MKPIQLSLILLLFTSFSNAQTYPSGKSILDKVDKNMSVKSQIVKSKMEINSSRGVRTMELQSWTEGSEKSFTEYLAPVREKGTKMLKIANKLWIYSPATDRIIQISGHMLRQSVMGSDLSYEDMMSNQALLEQYAAVVTTEEELDGRNCWVVKLTAITSDVVYFSQKMWVDQERNIPLKVELFAKSGKLLKQIAFADVQKIQNRWYPMTYVYKDMLKAGKGTKLMIEDVKLDVKIPTTVFNMSNLK